MTITIAQCPFCHQDLNTFGCPQCHIFEFKQIEIEATVFTFRVRYKPDHWYVISNNQGFTYIRRYCWSDAIHWAKSVKDIDNTIELPSIEWDFTGGEAGLLEQVQLVIAFQ